jgi:hypothetical protein
LQKGTEVIFQTNAITLRVHIVLQEYRAHKLNSGQRKKTKLCALPDEVEHLRGDLAYLFYVLTFPLK